MIISETHSWNIEKEDAYSWRVNEKKTNWYFELLEGIGNQWHTKLLTNRHPTITPKITIKVWLLNNVLLVPLPSFNDINTTTQSSTKIMRMSWNTRIINYIICHSFLIPHIHVYQLCRCIVQFTYLSKHICNILTGFTFIQYIWLLQIIFSRNLDALLIIFAWPKYIFKNVIFWFLMTEEFDPVVY